MPVTYYHDIKGDRANLLSDRRLVFMLAAVPFVINDPFYAWLDAPSTFYWVNYGLRIFVLFALVWWPVSRQLVFERHLPAAPIGRSVLTVFALPALCWVSFWYVVVPLAMAVGAVNQTNIPDIENPYLVALNLTFGLLLISLSEELIFRKLSYVWLSKAGLSQARIVLWSAVFFSVTHWGGGFIALTNTMIMGALYMIFYIKVGRLWPLVLAHWLHNFIYLGLY